MNPEFQHITDDLLVKCLLGEATPAEQEQVDRWRKASAANEAYYQGFHTLLEQSRNLPRKSDADTEPAWQRLQHRIRKTEKKKRAFPWLRMAAMLVLLAGIGFISYRLITREKVEKLVVQAGNETITDTLPDRSVVSLNRHSLITYNSEFEKHHRSVYLVGEAYFEVQPDPARPFIVRVNDIEVKVTGTAFNIRSRAGTTEVIVSSGHVQVTKAQNTVSLKAKEKVTVKAGDTVLVKKPETESLFHYYHSGTFVCDNTPLWKLVAALNEAYDTRIVIGRKSLRNLPLSGTYPDDSLDEILEVISKTLDITITRTGETIVLK